MNGYRRPAAIWNDMKAAVRAFITELAALAAPGSQPGTTLRIRPSGVDLLKREGTRRELLLTIPGRPQEAVRARAEKWGARLGRNCALEFDTGLSVTHRMNLPAESNEILRAIVRNKVESIAPWPLSQSLYAQRVHAVPGDPHHVAVTVGVVSRALLEEITAQLAAAGTVAGAAFLLLPGDEALRIDAGLQAGAGSAERAAARVAGGLAALAAVAAAFGLFLVWQSANHLANDRTEMESLLSSLQPSAKGGGTPLVQAANGLNERRRQRPPAVAVLNELSALLPQNVWLDSLSLEDSGVEFKGQGSGIPALIGILEQSPFFRDVNFASATQFNADRNTEAFSIRAAIESAAQEGPAP